MKKIPLLAAGLLALAPGLDGTLADEINAVRARVEWIDDGDTFKATVLNSRETIKVRVLGIDCPESSANSKCIRENGSKAACEKNEVLLGKKALHEGINRLKGQTVGLQTPAGTQSKDHYGRTLAYVQTEGGSDYGLHMIQKGFCEDFGYRYPHPRQPEYEAAQKKAGKWPVKPKEKRR